MMKLHCATQLFAKLRSLIFVLFILGELFISCYIPLLIHTRMISMPPSDFPVSTHETIHCENKLTHGLGVSLLGKVAEHSSSITLF